MRSHNLNSVTKQPSQSYKDLIAWQKSRALVREIYRHTSAFPSTEIYGLINQLRRAAVSIPSNLAEGQGRLSLGEFKQFIGHAKGSACELETQLLIARDLGYLQEQAAQDLLYRAEEIGRILSGLLASLRHMRAKR